MNTDYTSIKQNIEKAIKDGSLTMKPKWKFALASVLVGIMTLIVALLVLFCVSFVFFSLHEGGLHSLPWMLSLVALVCLALLEVFIRRFPLGYRQPMLYSGTIVLIILLGGGLLISYTSFHRHLRERDRGFYDMIGPRQPVGEIEIRLMRDGEHVDFPRSSR